MSKPNLPLDDLSIRHTGLTEEIGEVYTQAARVCLDRHHISPVELMIKNSGNEVAAVAEWHVTDERTKAAWANETDATEAGAYACALAAVELTNGLFAVRRAETKTGADYYIAPAGQALEDLEDCYRLEVSGVDKGTAAVVSRRLEMKLEQAAVGVSNLPAMAGVVGFRAKLILFERLIDQ